ncbi:MAG TPA: hypothetical protein DCZ04_03510 [Syntrophorhabdus aromaticivorans]|jgi:hypothetical protein|nr:hypothetical protein [Syntrophorhabdus aromaticivorans]
MFVENPGPSIERNKEKPLPKKAGYRATLIKKYPRKRNLSIRREKGYGIAVTLEPMMTGVRKMSGL